eukprot:CAMPEP_0168441726 /NCGR_PEP_ID=MMETSP0228-20121227/43642_1 /TAXON_ID=133427 /ORGANISM="Protoceratium reticulatum, Strain CCCM 535 (=CCMP 1889)" /LENGTH=513 /DNA_ID=CAMNT_0008456067 /DNA_START=38 /DNA_END=1579 /DNA_ORIENTATION=-
MAAMELALKCWIHPTMKLGFQLDPSQLMFRVPSTLTAMELMEKVEAMVEGAGQQEGEPVQVQLQVLWNLTNSKRALSPNDRLAAHFVSGDTFGVYGDVMPVPRQMPNVPETEKLPVTILTGFLGSGKTTLLNYILQEQKEKKIAVIENEFGEISIDDALLKQDKLAFAEKVVVMDNGCMCCTVRGDLIKGLRQILDEVHQGKKLDAIFIETTGMADPVPIVRTFMTAPEVSSELRLDGVIAVADAKHIIARLDDEVEEGKVNEAYQQVAFCDKMLLNKIDLVTPEQAIGVKDRLRSINAFAKIVPSVKGRVKVTELTNLRAHDMTHFVDSSIEVEAAEDHGHEGHGGHGGGHDGHGEGHEGHGGHGGHGDGHGHDCKEEGHGHEGHGSSSSGGHGHDDGHGHASKKSKSRHDSRVNSMAICREGEMQPKKLSEWMASLGKLPKERGTIFRIKGILAVKNHPFKHVFHAVMDVSDEDDAGPWAEGEKKISKIVFIGKNLDQQFLRDGFEGTFEV